MNGMINTMNTSSKMEDLLCFKIEKNTEWNELENSIVEGEMERLVDDWLISWQIQFPMAQQSHIRQIATAN